MAVGTEPMGLGRECWGRSGAGADPGGPPRSWVLCAADSLKGGTV